MFPKFELSIRKFIWKKEKKILTPCVQEDCENGCSNFHLLSVTPASFENDVRLTNIKKKKNTYL